MGGMGEEGGVSSGERMGEEGGVSSGGEEGGGSSWGEEVSEGKGKGQY